MNKKPSIRFKGFTDDWEQSTLGKMCISFDYGLNVAAKEFDGKNKYIRITDIDDETRLFLKTDLMSPDTNLNNANNYKLQNGDIVFARTGASVGKSYIYRNFDGLVYYAGFLIRARTKPEYNTDFIFQSTLTRKYIKYINITSQRSGQPGVNAQEYSEFEIFIPDFTEQKKIGTFFKYVDNLILVYESKYKKLKDIKKAMLEKMFPKEGSNIPEIRFKEFTDPWKQLNIGSIFDYERPDAYIVSNDKYLDNSVTPVLTANKGFILGYTNETNTYNNIPCIIFDDFTLDCKYVDFPFMVKSSAIKILTTKDNYNLKFAFELLNLTKIEIMGHARHYISVVQPTVVFVAQNKEQEKIGTFFKYFDSLVNLYQNKLEKLKNIKKSMLEKMFV